MEPTQLDAALQELTNEREALNRLRSDYATVARSRFFSRGGPWNAIKALLGLRRAAIPVGTPTKIPFVAGGTHALFTTPDCAKLVATWNARAATSPLSQKPLVSIVIPAHNHLDTTLACLQSMADTWFETLGVQVIVVDDASTDATSALVGLLKDVDLITNGANQGFILSCNRAAAIARGKYICFLNNDTLVSDAWLDELVSLAESDETIGAVGAKLVYPDGKLQEAGGIIFRDGTGWNYGRSERADDPRYNFVRDVDYCSGAALLVRADAFRELGGFDERYVPAYYEDTDLCFGLRSLGYRVVYQPTSVVVHLEGISSGTDVGSGTKRYQEVNRGKFVEKWQEELAYQCKGGREDVANAARRRRGRTILVIDSYVPMYDKEAGSNRLFRILQILLGLGYYVFFLPDNYAALQPYTQELQALGVEVLHHVHDGRTAQEALNEINPLLDFAWICRPELYQKYADLIRRNKAARIIYDTIDLHFIREKREAELRGTVEAATWKESEHIELNAARTADATVAVSLPDRDVLVDRGIANVALIPTIHVAQTKEPRPFAERSGILFIGGYNHTPNVDAAEWLVHEIMPIVWMDMPNVKVTLLGSNPPQSVLDLTSARVCVPGYQRDVSTYFENHRVFVAPLRFGAGLKGKIGQSLEYSLPLVTTPIGAEGFRLRNAENCYIATTAEAFADAIRHLYTNEHTWTSYSKASHEALGEFGEAAVAIHIRRMLENLPAVAEERE